MTISISDILDVLRSILDRSITREAADRWAFDIVQKSEAEGLIFSPASDEEKIWSAVMYLYGIDSKNSPERYLYTYEDILEFSLELGKPKDQEK